MSISGINVRNQIKGVVKHIQMDDFVSEVEVNTASGVVTSVITTRTLQQLGLTVGTEVVAVVMATEVSLTKPQGISD